MAVFGQPGQIKVSSQQLIITVSIKEAVTSLELVMCGVDRPAIVGKHCLIKVTVGCRGRNRVSQWCPETKAESLKENAPRLNQFIGTYTCDLFRPRPPRQSADWVYFNFSLSSRSDGMKGKLKLSSHYRIFALISQSQMFFLWSQTKAQNGKDHTVWTVSWHDSGTHRLIANACWSSYRRVAVGVPGSKHQAMRADPPVLSASLLCSHLQQLSDPSLIMQRVWSQHYNSLIYDIIKWV